MGIGILVFSLAVAWLFWTITRTDTRVAPTTPRPALSPLDDAERILSARYARGDMSLAEYERMLTILKR